MTLMFKNLDIQIMKHSNFDQFLFLTTKLQIVNFSEAHKMKDVKG